MIDLLTVWGLGKIPGFLFKDVLSCLVEEGGANFVKSLFLYSTIKDIAELLPSQDIVGCVANAPQPINTSDRIERISN